VKDNWAGLVIDGSADQVARIRQRPEYWYFNLKAVEAFVTAENINHVLEAHGVTGEIGLLSIDIDGMDYWVWKAIEVVSPAIVVIEYNHRFGNDDAVTVPYDPAFAGPYGQPHAQAPAHHQPETRSGGNGGDDDLNQRIEEIRDSLREFRDAIEFLADSKEQRRRYGA
jgi:hypothetical protein